MDRVEVLGGAGTVWRSGDVVAWLNHGTPPTFAREVVGALARGTELPSDGADRSHHALAVARLGDAGTVVTTWGAVVVRDDEVLWSNGERSDGPVRTSVPPCTALVVQGSTDPDPLHRAGCLPFDLVDGTVPGGGFVVHRRGGLTGMRGTPASSASASVVDPPTERSLVPSSDEPGNRNGAGGEGECGTEAAADRGRGASGAAGGDASTTLDEGVTHLPTDQAVEGVTDEPRRRLGILVLDDGSSVTLDDGYLIGRTAESIAEAGSPLRPLVIDDGSGEISRVHAEVRLNGRQVVVIDVGSRNGTYVLNPDDASWTQLQKDVPVVLQPGGRVAVGKRTLEFRAGEGC